ncbi:MAG: hypothetical protein IMZ58_11570 [Thermoplasmata archaeon]|nr:hypothetical protein [Thermoplasmata archaeon]
MKKQWMTGIIIGVLLLMGASTMVYAKGPLYGNQDISIQATSENTAVKTDTTLPLSTDTPQVKFRGIWGYEGSNETCGYLGGVLVKRERVVVLKGLWNTTDNMTKGNIVGILKRGYFNGKIITQNQTKYRIVGLYRYDAENNLLHLRWMTAQQTGWAHCRILVN